jgi:hypothetical protein
MPRHKATLPTPKPAPPIPMPVYIGVRRFWRASEFEPWLAQTIAVSLGEPMPPLAPMDERLIPAATVARRLGITVRSLGRRVFLEQAARRAAEAAKGASPERRSAAAACLELDTIQPRRGGAVGN